jgi:hypothetical protein
MSRAVTLAELADQAVFTVDANSNFVGIGSTIPSGKLDVDGAVSATAFVGSGASLTGVISGVELQFGGSSVGTAVTNINFVGFSSVTAPVSGLATVTTSKQLTIGVRVGSAVTFSIVGAAFTVDGRSAAITIDA